VQEESSSFFKKGNCPGKTEPKKKVTFLAYYLANDRNSVKENALPPTT
jgi:hypothetical protein